MSDTKTALAGCIASALILSVAHTQGSIVFMIVTASLVITASIVSVVGVALCK